MQSWESRKIKAKHPECFQMFSNFILTYIKSLHHNHFSTLICAADVKALKMAMPVTTLRSWHGTDLCSQSHQRSIINSETLSFGALAVSWNVARALWCSRWWRTVQVCIPRYFCYHQSLWFIKMLKNQKETNRMTHAFPWSFHPSLFTSSACIPFQTTNGLTHRRLGES